MVESSRKHGAFDTRYPLLSQPATPAVVLAGKGLEWNAFLARFFPSSRRHATSPLIAYVGCRDIPAQPALDSTSAAAVWEGEGGRPLAPAGV